MSNNLQSHSHPVLRRQAVEKQTQSKSSDEIVPVDEHSASVPSFVSSNSTNTNAAIEAERRSKLRIEYASDDVLRKRQDDCSNILDEYENKTILYVGGEHYDHATITVLQGLRQLGFTIHTLKKRNVNSWFCNNVVDSTAGLDLDFVLSNVGWGTRWSYYSRYRLSRFPTVLIDGIGDPLSWDEQVEELRSNIPGDAPDDVDDLDVQPYIWTDKVGSYTPDVVFSTCPVLDEIRLPLGAHKGALEMSANNATHDRSLELGTFSDISEGEAIIPPDVAGAISQDIDSLHGWHRWIRWQGHYDFFNSTNMVLCNPVLSLGLSNMWSALACGCLPMVVSQNPNRAHYLTLLSPFTVCKSEDELTDKHEWLAEHPSLLARLRTDCERLVKEYFSPVPVAKRFLYDIQERVA